MADFRIPGPVGTKMCMIDSGTNVLRFTPSPGPVGGPSNAVASMALDDRFVSVMHRTLPKLPADIREEFAALLSPSALAAIVGVLVVWAGSHYIGVGFIVDALLLLGGVFFLGWQIISAASDLMSCIELTYNARSEDELEKAATHLSNFIAVVGVAAFVALLTKGAGKKINVKSIKAKVMTKLANATDAGMTPNHFQGILKVAMDPKNPKVILFRRTNPESVKYIERGFPAKPKEIKVKTKETSGIATCDDLTEVNQVRMAVDPVSKKKFYTVDRGRKTATNGDGHTIDLDGADWPVEPGQVIDPTTQKPLVGDYDLFDVFDPQVLAGTKPANQGNLVLATSEGKFVSDFTNPAINKAIKDMNNAIGSRRVMHGPHGAFDSIDNLKPDEIVTAFLPDGTVVSMNKEALTKFYQKIGRSTLDLKKWMDLDTAK